MEQLEASVKGNISAVEQLVSSEASVDAADNGSLMSLARAARNGNLNVVRYLVEHGAVVNARDLEGWTPLMQAAENGHLNVVRFLVKYGAVLNTRDFDGRSPLMFAVSGGHFDVVCFLVEHGADVDGCNLDGKTPLMWATSGGHLDMVRFLVEQGAAVNARDSYSWTPLMRAVRDGHLDIVQYLVERGAAVDARSLTGKTPLMRATDNGHLDVVRFLVGRGAAVNKSNNGGWTPLIRATGGRHVDMVRFLLESGAEVDALDRHGRTSLMQAVHDGYLDMVRILVESGATVDASDKDGQTSLTMAAKDNYLDMVHYLVERGAAVDARDKTGLTILMQAAKDGNLDMVKYLVEHGANVNMKSSAGDTALSRASTFGRQEVVQFLLPFVRYRIEKFQLDQSDEKEAGPSNIPSSWLVAPFELDVEQFVDAGHIGEDYRGKWLDTDVAIKLFVDDTSSATFLDEVCMWHKLRHPNVLKLYGICIIHHQLFVCEFASKGSLPAYLKSCDSEDRTPWKHLYEAALGLEYLHERKIVHGKLRGSNILIGSDGLAKLSGFGLSASLSEGGWYASGDWVRWAAPESVKGKRVSFASDVYMLGMCIVEALSGKVPYTEKSEMDVESMKNRCIDLTNYRMCYGVFSKDNHRQFVLAMCRADPFKRLQMPAVVSKLEEFARMEATTVTQLTEPESLVAFDEFDHGKMSSLWSVVQGLVYQSKNAVYRQFYHELKLIYDTLKANSHPWSTLQRFHDLLSECRVALGTMSLQNRVYRLSATRARDHSVQGLHRRISQLLQLARPQDQDAEKRETEWKRLCREQIEIFVSEASEACVMLSSVDSEEDRSALVAVLRAELRNSGEKYTGKQLTILQKTCDDIVSKSLGDVKLATTPEWFIPWFELEMNEMATLGEGGFGSVIKAKWLDSEVVVKKLEITDKDAANVDKKREMWQMFEREVDIWFGLSHPHVVRLFGACHVGRPFFVCELAPNGTLVEYLRHHPDEIWVKLREAALGVQYLYARGIVHGDLKGNNILVGSDRKAKVTDFGLSGAFGDDSTEVVVSGAWHWVAPECILGQNPTFASDIYSLGMCVVEALRVTNSDEYTLPWGNLPNAAVKFHVTKKHLLPKRPSNCSDEVWTLIERMCKSNPADRMLIITVVDELEKLAGLLGDFCAETVQSVSDNGEMHNLFLPSVADTIDEMKSWIAKCDTGSDWEGGVLAKIYQLLWDRLEQVTTQFCPDVEDTIGIKTKISDLIALVEHSKQRTQAALNTTDVIPLIKFTESALGGYALHRRLDKFMAAHAVQTDSSTLHDWMSACSTFMGVSNSPTPPSSEGDCRL